MNKERDHAYCNTYGHRAPTRRSVELLFACLSTSELFYNMRPFTIQTLLRYGRLLRSLATTPPVPKLKGIFGFTFVVQLLH